MQDYVIGVERASRPEHTPEAEQVVVCLDGQLATLVLDDGEELRFDRTELLKALAA